MEWSVFKFEVDNYDVINRPLLKRFHQCYQNNEYEGSHWIVDHFENIYIDKNKIPEVQPILERALSLAAEKFGAHTKIGKNYWFNLARQGQTTEEHDHTPGGMNINYCSGVYYLRTPPGCGNIVFENGLEIEPVEGLMLLFPCEMKHSVRANLSSEDRISLAFNLECC